MTDVIVTFTKVADVNHPILEVIGYSVTDGSHICLADVTAIRTDVVVLL